MQTLMEFETRGAVVWLGKGGPDSLLECTGLAQAVWEGRRFRGSKVTNITVGGKHLYGPYARCAIKPITNRLTFLGLRFWLDVIPGQDGPPTFWSAGDSLNRLKVGVGDIDLLLGCQTKEGPFDVCCWQ